LGEKLGILLKNLHAANICHGDLHCDNIMVENKLHVYKRLRDGEEVSTGDIMLELENIYLIDMARCMFLDDLVKILPMEEAKMYQRLMELYDVCFLGKSIFRYSKCHKAVVSFFQAYMSSFDTWEEFDSKYNRELPVHWKKFLLFKLQNQIHFEHGNVTQFENMLDFESDFYNFFYHNIFERYNQYCFDAMERFNNVMDQREHSAE
jgi:hypothetical protein